MVKVKIDPETGHSAVSWVAPGGGLTTVFVQGDASVLVEELGNDFGFEYEIEEGD